MKRVGVDTNIVLRLVVGDDEKQLQVAERFQQDVFSRGNQIYLSLIVIVESVWALRQIFKFSKERIILVLEHYLLIQGAELEEPEMIWKALELYRNSSADFSDCLILARNQGAEVLETMTFDRKASTMNGFSLLA